jgi:hypothetical protein
MLKAVHHDTATVCAVLAQEHTGLDHGGGPMVRLMPQKLSDSTAVRQPLRSVRQHSC